MERIKIKIWQAIRFKAQEYATVYLDTTVHPHCTPHKDTILVLGTDPNKPVCCGRFKECWWNDIEERYELFLADACSFIMESEVEEHIETMIKDGFGVLRKKRK